MTDYYGKWVETAKRMLNKRGSVCAWTTVRPSGPDWAPTTVEQTFNDVKMLILPTDRYAYETFNIDPKTDMLRGFSVGYMAAQEFVPNLKDYFVMSDGRKYVVDNMNVYQPDGRPILYVLLVRL